VIGILGIMIYSIKKDKPELYRIVASLVLLRAYLPLFDFEDRKKSNTVLSNSIFFIASCNGLFV